MSTSKHCLLIENDDIQAETWIRLLKTENYSATRCLSAGEADSFWATNREASVDVVAIDLGLPPEEESLRIGAEYAVSLRQKMEDIPILAYTAQIGKVVGEEDWDLRRTIRYLLPWKISILYTRNLPKVMRFQQALDLTANGIVIVSPHPASLLTEAISNKPDPLSKDYWETLKNLSTTTNIDEAAAKTRGVKKSGFMRRLEEIKKTLVALGEFESEGGIYKEDLVAWYQNNHVKYLRGL